MRVTDSYAQRSYLNNNNRALDNQLKYQNRVLTQKAFLRASEDSVSANSAMKIRKNLENLDMYDKNLNTAHELFSAAETNLYNIADNIYLKTKSLVVSAQDTLSQMEFDAIALDLEEKAKEMMSSMNVDFGDRQLFAGTGNNKEPFTIEYQMTNADGTIMTDSTGKPIVVPDDRHQAGDIGSTDPLVKYPEITAGSLTVKIGDENYTVNASGTNVTPEDFVNNLVDSNGDKVDPPMFEINEKDGTFSYTGNKTLDASGDANASAFMKAIFDGKDSLSVKQTAKVPVYELEDKISDKTKLEFTKPDGEKVTIENSSGITVKDLVDSGEFTYDEKTGVLTHTGDYSLKSADSDTAEFINDNFGTGDRLFGADEEILRKAVVSYNTEDVSSHNEAKDFKGAGGIYVDVGLGVNYNKDGTIIPSTAMDIALSGAKLTGCGTDKDGDSKNIIQLTFDAANALNRGDLKTVNRLIDKLDNAHKTVLSSIVTLGTKQNDIDFYIDKNEDYRTNLKEKQNKTEGCDLTTEIINLESAKAAYSASLQIGASTVPNSIFDFIR